jgi:xylose isomerase
VPKHSVITSFLSKTKDRFHEYNEEKNLEEKFQMISQLEGIEAAEVVFPYEVSSVDELNQLKGRYNVGLSAVNVNVKAEPEFRNGGLTSTVKSIREKAVQFIKDAKDFARQVGADKVTCCPLADGYEFSFQTDYGESWRYLVETFGEAGSYMPEIPLFIEYKPKETRGKCFLDSAAKTLLLIKDIGISSLGITVDIGHSIYGNENPAEAISLIAHNGTPFYVHSNDNDGTWDWDYMVASKNFLVFVEFIYYLQKFDYKDYITSDSSPTRFDIKSFFEANVRWTSKIWERLEKIDKKTFDTLIRSDNFMETWRYIEEEIFRL